MTEVLSQPEDSSQSKGMVYAVVRNVRDYAIFVTDTEGCILSWNFGVEDLLGYTEDQFTGQHISTIFTPEDVARGVHLREMEKAKTQGRGENRQRWHVRRDGMHLCANSLVVPLCDETGTLRGHTILICDSTKPERDEDAPRESDELSRSIIESSADCITLLDLDGHLLSMNEPGLCSMEIADFNLLKGRSWVDFLWQGPELRDARVAVNVARSGGTGRFRGSRKTAAGALRWWDVIVSPIFDAEGNPERLVLVTRDITEHTQAEEKLRTSEVRYRRLFESARDGILILDAVTRKITDANPYMAELLGYTHDEFLGKELWEIGLLKDEQASQVAFQVLQEKGYIRYEDLPLETGDGKNWEVEFVSNVYRENGHQVIQCNIRDITERKAAEDLIKHFAFHDALTGLANRLLLIEHLKRAIAHAERHDDYRFAVLFLDLDCFKVINDSLGHVIADQLLMTTARKLEAVMRPEDVVARFGGDEFTVLLNDIQGESDATHVADCVQQALSEPFNLNGHEVFTSASIGITLCAHGGYQPKEVLRDADTAMYRAKTRGRGRYEIFDSSMHERVMQQLKLENDLKRAVERREFLLHYQPILSLGSNQITGFEALVRWQHPERGLVPPMEFIPVAEDTGLIVPIGRMVLYEASRRMRQWRHQFRNHGPLSISVNFSSNQFLQSDLLEQIDDALHQTGLDADSLKLEITESVTIDKAESITRTMGRLQALGVKLHIDDFGTGYSNLSYLYRYPIEMLKIDRSFVSRIGTGDENSLIAQTIVQLAHNLGIKVVAEGVETAEQLEQLRKMGCEYAQGYYFSRPVDGRRVQALLAA